MKSEHELPTRHMQGCQEEDGGDQGGVSPGALARFWLWHWTLSPAVLLSPLLIAKHSAQLLPASAVAGNAHLPSLVYRTACCPAVLSLPCTGFLSAFTALCISDQKKWVLRGRTRGQGHPCVSCLLSWLWKVRGRPPDRTSRSELSKDLCFQFQFHRK